jgi:acetyltransferase
MDMVAGAGPKEFRYTLAAVERDKRFDTIIAIFVPPVTMDQLEVATNIQAALKNTKKTIMACFMGADEVGIQYLKDHNIPVYIFPEAIAKTLKTIDGYRKWKFRKIGKVRSFKADSARVEEVLARVLKGKSGSVVGDDAIEILHAYGIQVAGYQYAESANKAVAVSKEIGYPVVMKIATPPILHKTEVGGVLVDIRSDAEVRSAFNELKKRVGTLKKGESFSVALQQMVTGGVETVIGMTTDPQFGPLMMCGLGGIYVEIMKDVSFRINPLTDQGARQMIESLRGYPLLTGFRGAKPVDLGMFEETLLRLSQLVRDFACFSEIDINPFIVSPEEENCKAVDARFIVTDTCAHRKT